LTEALSKTRGFLSATKSRVIAGAVKMRNFRDARRGTPSTETADLPEMLTAKDLERLLKIDVKTIYSYVQRGLIPYVKIQSNVRFVKQQILGWIEARNFRPR